MITCPMCERAEGALLGELGNLVWLRCPACGMDWAIEDDDKYSTNALGP